MIPGTSRNSLGRIQHTAATHSQHQLYLFPLTEGHALPYQAHLGVGLYAAQLYIFHTSFLKRGNDLVIETAAPDTARTIMKQNLLITIAADKSAHLMLSIPAKNHTGRGVILKIFHDDFLSVCYF